MSKMLGELLLYSGKDMSKFFTSIGRSTYKSELDLSTFWATSTSDFGIANKLFWWNDPLYEIGRITAQERQIVLIDTHKGNLRLVSALFLQFKIPFFCRHFI